jgi:hypothetical protein
MVISISDVNALSILSKTFSKSPGGRSVGVPPPMNIVWMSGRSPITLFAKSSSNPIENLEVQLKCKY